MTIFSRLLGTCCVTVALVCASAAGAHAASWTHRDAARDVVKVVQDGEVRPVPDRRAGDIRTVVARHLSTTVVVRFTMATPLPRGRWYFSMNVDTRAQTYGIYVSGRGGAADRPAFSRQGPGGDDAVCRRLRVVVDQSSLSVKVVVPRACIGRPRVVRVALDLATYVGDTTYQDDGLQRAAFGNVYSPFLRRG
ncbi:hypothetical protein CFH99_16215 [Nocardioides aromaticivorans]|uniref:Uncharacterized protein n=2 Tax=Nocardioides aromaticivorans TaxID=200618 RepID=A0ABX7PN73_9ACTN|nr:hypothetical protein CFH99_16215 [Nocardioides aromaticivorans]